jgi:hypothetical protein
MGGGKPLPSPPGAPRGTTSSVLPAFAPWDYDYDADKSTGGGNFNPGIKIDC